MAIQEKEVQVEQLQGQLAVLRAEKFCQSNENTTAYPRALAGDDAAVRASRAALTAAFDEAFGIEFEPRGNQAHVLASVTAGRNVVSVDPPGAGKTLTLYGVALVMNGVVIFVQPTLDLIVQTVDGLNARSAAHGKGVIAVHHDIKSYNSDFEGVCTSEGSAVKGPCSNLIVEFASGSVEQLLLNEGCPYRLVACTPERLDNASFRRCLAELRSAGRLVAFGVDEAHLVTQWGRRFRESYLRLGGHINEVGRGSVLTASQAGSPPPRLIVLSGTLNPQQAKDVLTTLQQDYSIFDIHFQPLDRPHLAYSTLNLCALEGTRSDVLKATIVYLAEQLWASKKSIVFVDTADDAACVAAHLNELSGPLLCAVPFYSKLGSERQGSLDRFQKEGSCVLVATVLAAHGLDYPNVRMTVHLALRSSAQTLLQEHCRAGRDGAPARCIQVLHPNFLLSAADLLDLREGADLFGLRQVLKWALDDESCMRAHLLRMVGCQGPRASSCINCGGCSFEASPFVTHRDFLNMTHAARALIGEVNAANGRAAFVSTVREGAWRKECRAGGSANALFLHLFAHEVLSFSLDTTAAAPAAGEENRGHVYVAVNQEKAAPILDLAADVLVRCCTPTGLFD
jgi:superfamily II DNA helicase RecQ